MKTDTKLIFTGIGCVLVIVLILVIVYIFESPVPLKLTMLEVVREKCEEYAEVACDNPVPSNMVLQDEPAPFSRGRIVGDGVYPHMAWLHTKIPCPGTLISEYFILTSAGCWQDSKAENFKVKIGTADILGNKPYRDNANDFFDDNTGTIYTAEKVIFHDKYNYNDGDTYLYAIALVKLSKKVEFDWRKRPICLSSEIISKNEANMTTCGWGINEDEKWVTKLHTVDQYNNPDMERLCASSFSPELLEFNSLMCVGNSEFNAGICAADLGAPLQIPLRRKDVCANNTYEQIGIALAFNRICTRPYPKSIASLYIRVEQIIDWIVRNVWPEMVEDL